MVSVAPLMVWLSLSQVSDGYSFHASVVVGDHRRIKKTVAWPLHPSRWPGQKTGSLNKMQGVHNEISCIR